MRFFYCTLAGLSAVFLAACNIEDTIRRTLPDAAVQVSDRAVEYFLLKDSEGLRSIAAPEFIEQATDDALVKLYAYRGSGELISKEIIGAKTFASTASGASVLVNYSVELSDKNLVISVVLKKYERDYLLTTLNVNSAEKAPSGIPPISLAGKSPVHFGVMALSIGIPIFILGTLVACLRTKGVKRRILWAIFILFGVGSVTFNWSTGAIGLSLLRFNLFGVGVLYENSWIFRIGVPLGAIFWWARQRHPASSKMDADTPIT